MEVVLAFALLWDVRFCSAEDYRRVLDGCAIASEDRALLQGLANMGRFRESRTDTARLAARLLEENLSDLDVRAFAEVLFRGVERARRMVRFEEESFTQLGYALWLALPEILRERDPFVSLKEEFQQSLPPGVANG